MSKLLARAKVKRINAENDFDLLDQDDAFLDDCCYNLQQAIELALKYLVEMYGENYVENHDIRAQINKLKNMGINLPFESELRHLASVINSWEAESRYNDEFTAIIEDIKEVRALADKVIQYCETLVKKIS